MKKVELRIRHLSQKLQNISLEPDNLSEVKHDILRLFEDISFLEKSLSTINSALGQSVADASTPTDEPKKEITTESQSLHTHSPTTDEEVEASATPPEQGDIEKIESAKVSLHRLPPSSSDHSDIRIPTDTQPTAQPTHAEPKPETTFLSKEETHIDEYEPAHQSVHLEPEEEKEDASVIRLDLKQSSIFRSSQTTFGGALQALNSSISTDTPEVIPPQPRVSSYTKPTPKTDISFADEISTQTIPAYTHGEDNKRSVTSEDVDRFRNQLRDDSNFDKPQAKSYKNVDMRRASVTFNQRQYICKHLFSDRLQACTIFLEKFTSAKDPREKIEIFKSYEQNFQWEPKSVEYQTASRYLGIPD